MSNGQQVRDGLPTIAEIRHAAALLQIPLDEEGIGTASMTEERQVTCLLAVLGSWLNAYQMVQENEVDRLSLDELGMLVSSAETEVAGELPTATINGALWRIQWAALTVAEVGRHPAPENPTGAIGALLRAAALILTSWRDSHGGEGFTLDGQDYSVIGGELVCSARQETVAALAEIDRLIGPDDSS